MKALEQEVREERKVALDRARVYTIVQVGLRRKELLDAAEVGRLRP